nr:GNAT family N-acetyltransferase [Palleronia aestuarii]
MNHLTTETLILRRPVAADLDPYVAFFTSERSRFAEGPVTDDQAWRMFGTELGHWELRGFGMFTVTSKDDAATPLGLVGPWFPAGWPEPEIGWLLWPEAEGRGIGLEAGKAVRDHVFRDLGWTTAVSYIERGNDRSAALARRLGAEIDPTAKSKNADTLVYRHPLPREVAA